MDAKFDVVVMNPPYQPPIKGFGKSGGNAKTLYDKFVKLAMNDLVKQDGYLCAVHPPKWRRPADALWPTMQNKQVKYIEIHDKKDGQKTFGATTRYDWYVLKNSTNNGELTDVLDEQGIKQQVDLTNWPFFPNSHFKDIEGIIAKSGQKTCNLLYSYTAYPTNIPQSWMSREKTDTHVHPCVCGTGKKGVVLAYTNRREEFFGVPKVIFGDGDRIHNAILDFKGEYGFTPHAMAIPIASEEEGTLLKKALESKRFNEIIKACKWSSFQIDYRLFRHFREDFWQEFI